MMVEASAPIVFREVAATAAHRGYVWLMQDVQTKAMWRSLVARFWNERRQYPVLVAFTKEDATDYARVLPDDVPHAIVLMRDYYADIVEGSADDRPDAVVFEEASNLERRYGITLLRGLILSDRHLGRDLMTGARGFAMSKIAERRSMRTMCQATITSFRFWEALALRFPPVLALAYAGGAGLGGRPASLVLRERRVPFRNLSYTRFGSRFFWADDEFAVSWRFASHFAATSVTRDDLLVVDTHVGVQVLTSDEIKRDLQRGKRLTGVLRKMATTTARHAYGYVRGYAKSRRGYRLDGTLAAIFRSWSHERWLDRHCDRDLARVDGRQIVYHALQVEPELTTTLFGQYASDQFGLVREISMSLRADMVLVVKEHPWQVGSRDIDFYRRIAALPNVILVHHRYPSVDLIRRSLAVSTGSSSVAFEAAVLGIPAFHTMASSLLDPIAHVIAMPHRQDPDKIAEIRTDDAARDARRLEGARLMQALLTFGFAFGDAGLMKRSAPLTDEEWVAMARDLDDSLRDQAPAPLLASTDTAA